MAKGINKVILIGNITQDPEIRYTNDGKAIANINVATNEEWRDKSTGEKKSKAEYHRVVIFGKLAEIAGEYLKKGSQVYIEGQLQTRKWQDQQGQDRYSTEVVVNPISGTLQMLGGGTDRASNQASNKTKGTLQNEPPLDFDDDSIPF